MSEKDQFRLTYQFQSTPPRRGGNQPDPDQRV